MNKKLTLLLLFSFMLTTALKAQMSDGSVAPNFTVTDIDGNTWNLYDILDSGKNVVIDFSATWCGPCWDFHNSGQAESLYDQYGPDGTDEMMMIMIEGDPATSLECLYGQDGCVGTTIGDWTDGVHYPIINDDNLAEIYEIAYWPTIYHICENRIVTEVSTATASGMYAMNGDCKQASGSNNAGLLGYSGFEGTFCRESTFAPKATLQNLGLEEMTSVTANLIVDGTQVQTKEWTGNLSTYQIAEMVFDEVSFTADGTISIEVDKVNGVADEDNSNDVVAAETFLSEEVNQNIYTLSVLTDNYPGETYWEFMDDNRNVLYWGGNQAVVDGDETPYTLQGEEYVHEIFLPGNGCFEFNIYDGFGDGICCGEGQGAYSLTDSEGNVLFSGGNFGDGDFKPFSIEGNDTPIVHNGTIAGHNGESTYLCETIDFTPQIVLQNLGINKITSAGITVTSSESGEVSSLNWTGEIETGKFAFIELDAFSISETATFTTEITHINGETDAYDYNNQVSATYEKYDVNDDTFVIEFSTDDYGFEIYWEITTADGDVLAKGGNDLVGPDGGGLGVAAAGDPNAYGNNQLVTETISLPEGGVDCLTFKIVDDYGDGLAGSTSSFKLSDSQGVEVYNKSLSFAFLDDETTFNSSSAALGIDRITGISPVEIYPNPTEGELNVQFDVLEVGALNISIYNTVGQVVKTLDSSTYDVGKQNLQFNVSNLAEGMYHLIIANKTGQTSHKVTVTR